MQADESVFHIQIILDSRRYSISETLGQQSSSSMYSANGQRLTVYPNVLQGHEQGNGISSNKY